MPQGDPLRMILKDNLLVDLQAHLKILLLERLKGGEKWCSFGQFGEGPY